MIVTYKTTPLTPTIQDGMASVGALPYSLNMTTENTAGIKVALVLIHQTALSLHDIPNPHRSRSMTRIDYRATQADNTPTNGNTSSMGILADFATIAMKTNDRAKAKMASVARNTARGPQQERQPLHISAISS